MANRESKNTEGIKEGDSMSALAQYLKNNREHAYSYATANTKHNEQGRPAVSQNDEWINESEWDNLFDMLKYEKSMENNHE